MNITLRQLRAFVTVAQTGSFTQASDRLHVTRSALSGLIKELETALGVQLFERTTRRVALSPVGAEVLPIALRILEDVDHALDTVPELKALRSGLVRVAAAQLLASTLMPEAMGAFALRHPEVTLQLVDSSPDDVLLKVSSGEVDLGAGTGRDEMPGIEATPLFKEPLIAVIPRGHPLGRQRSITWSQLSREKVISLAGDYRRILNATLGSQGGPQLRPRMEVTYVSSAIALVRAGLGVTFCPRFAQSLARAPDLMTRPLKDPPIERQFYLFTRNNRALSPAAESFAKFLLSHVEAGRAGTQGGAQSSLA